MAREIGNYTTYYRVVVTHRGYGDSDHTEYYGPYATLAIARKQAGRVARWASTIRAEIGSLTGDWRPVEDADGSA